MSDVAASELSDEEINRIVKFHVQRYHRSRSPIEGVPEIGAAIQRLKNGDAKAAEWGIAYLELHPFHFRSGYLKNDLLRYLRHVALSDSQTERLRAHVLSVIQRRDRPDFKDLGALARRLDSPTLRESLEALANSGERTEANLAQSVLAACKMNDYREDLRGAR